MLGTLLGAGTVGALAAGAGQIANKVSQFTNSARQVDSGSKVDLAPITDMFNGFFDQLSGIAGQNSAMSADFAAQANQFSAQQAAMAREFNAAEAAKNRQWQEYMSNTAHQREVADLKAAGLNPVLSAMGGNGAAVTSGAAASATSPTGQQGQVDTSLSGSLVSMLSTLLGAQTQLQMMNTNARTQEAVAEKYTAMNKFVAELSAATSRANAQLSAETSRYGIDVSSWTSLSVAEKQAAVNRYAAELSSAAQRYGAYMSWDAATSIAEKQLEWQSQHPNNMWQGLGEVLSGLGMSPSDLGNFGFENPFISAGESAGNWIKSLFEDPKSKVDTHYSSSGASHRGAGRNFKK